MYLENIGITFKYFIFETVRNYCDSLILNMRPRYGYEIGSLFQKKL